MKKIKQFYKSNNRVYFHHQYGTHEFKNRKRLAALWSSSIIVASGCFLFVSTFLLPAIQNARYSHTPKNQVLAEQQKAKDDNAKKIEPINRNNTELENIVKQELNSFSSDQKWSVFIYDLKNDQTVKVNADEARDAASLYKIFLIEYLEQKIPYQEWASTWLVNQSISDCVYNMLQQTDDPCSEDLAKKLNLDKVDKFISKNGYKNTKMSENFGKQTSASDVGKLFVGLKKGQILGDGARRFVFDALYQQDIKKGLAKGCGDCRTANKIGELSNIAYDGGVVTHGGRSYVMVAMSEGGSFSEITKLTKKVDKFLNK